MRATAVGCQSVDRYSVQGKEGRKRKRKRRANVERDAVSRRRTTKGKRLVEEKGD